MSKRLVAIKDEIYDYFSVPYGYVFTFKYQADKKNNSIEIKTKDMREFKFKFDIIGNYFKAVDALLRHCQISKYKDFFSFDFTSRKMMLESETKIKTLNYNEICRITMDEFKRQGVQALEEKLKFMEL